MRRVIFFLFFLTGHFYSLNAEMTVEDLKNSVNAVQPFIEGWCTKEKASNFIDLVLEVKPELCVEIGVFAGSSIFPVASALKFLGKGIVVGIDPWRLEECIKNLDPTIEQASITWWSGVNLDYVYNLYLKMLSGYELEKYCVTFKTTSQKALPAIGTIDILYIDGNPGEQAFLNDVRLYLPKVRSGGFIWINNSISAEKKLALELLSETCDMVKTIDNGSCALFKKR